MAAIRRVRFRNHLAEQHTISTRSNDEAVARLSEIRAERDHVGKCGCDLLGRPTDAPRRVVQVDPEVVSRKFLRGHRRHECVERSSAGNHVQALLHIRGASHEVDGVAVCDAVLVRSPARQTPTLGGDQPIAVDAGADGHRLGRSSSSRHRLSMSGIRL